MTDTRADTIRQFIEHCQGFDIDVNGNAALTALDGLLADAAELRKERDSWQATAEILQDHEAMADLFESEKERAVAAEARVAALETAIRSYLDHRDAEWAEHGRPEHGDVPPWQTYPLSRLYDLAASTPAKHDPIGLHGEGRPNAYAPSAPATQKETT